MCKNLPTKNKTCPNIGYPDMAETISSIPPIFSSKPSAVEPSASPNSPADFPFLSKTVNLAPLSPLQGGPGLMYAQMPRCPDAQMPRRPDAQIPRCPDAQMPRRTSIQDHPVYLFYPMYFQEQFFLFFSQLKSPPHYKAFVSYAPHSKPPSKKDTHDAS